MVKMENVKGCTFSLKKKQERTEQGGKDSNQLNNLLQAEVYLPFLH